MKKLLLIAILLISAFLYSESAIDYYNLAQYYRLLSIAEKGDMQALAKAEENLALAQEKDKVEDLGLAKEIAILKTDLEFQRGMMFDTFRGMFPISSLMNTTIFIAADVNDSYEVADDPRCVAMSYSVTEIFSLIENIIRYKDQLDILVNSTPLDIELENEIIYLILNDSNFFHFSRSKLANELGENLYRDFNQNNIHEGLKDRILDFLDKEQFVVLNINAVAEFDDIIYFKINVKCYEENKLKPVFTISRNQFIRNHNRAYNYILFLILIALLVSALQFMLRRKDNAKINWESVLLSMLTYIAGFIIAYIFTVILLPFKPEPENLAILSFWWLCLHGVLILFLPGLLINELLKKFRNYFDIKFTSDVYNVLLPVALAQASYYLQLELIYMNSFSWTMLTTLVVILSINFCLGYHLEKHHKTKYLIIAPFLLAIIAEPAIVSLNIPFKIAATVLSLVFSGFIVFNLQKKKIKVNITGISPINTDYHLACPKTVEELREVVNKPPFCEYEDYKKTFKKIIDEWNKGLDILFIQGESGCGKSRTAAELISYYLKTTGAAEKKGYSVLTGECPQPVENTENRAYAPFISAFEDSQDFQHIINFQHTNNSTDHIKTLIDTFLPLTSYLLPGGDDDNDVSSPEEIRNLIIKFIRVLNKNNTVIIQLDDVQWIDEDSISLIKEIIAQKSSIENFKLILTGTENMINIEGVISDQHIAFNKNEDKRILTKQILTGSLNLNEEFVNNLLEYLNYENDNDHNLHTILNTVKFMSEQGDIVLDPDCSFNLKRSCKLEDCGVPKSNKETIMKQYRSVYEYHKYIMCAACIGYEFEAELLESIFRAPKLEFYFILDKIEDETSLILDDKENDGIFKFKSKSVLNALRDITKTHCKGPDNLEVPQVVRELNLSIAKELEIFDKYKKSSIFRVADHYYFAGREYADKALEYCLKAAKTKAQTFQFADAENYLRKAEEELAISGETWNARLEILRVQIIMSTKSGKNKKDTIYKCRQCKDFEKFADADLLLMASYLSWSYAEIGYTQSFLWAIRVLSKTNLTTLQLIRCLEQLYSDIDKMNFYSIINKQNLVDRLNFELEEPIEDYSAFFDRAFSLLNELPEESKTQYDRAKLHLLITKFGSYYKINKKNVKKIAKEIEDDLATMMNLAEEVEDYHLTTLAYFEKAGYYSAIDDLDTAAATISQVLEISSNRGILKSEARAYGKLGDIYKKQNKFDMALENYKCQFNKYLELDLKDNCVSLIMLSENFLKYLITNLDVNREICDKFIKTNTEFILQLTTLNLNIMPGFIRKGQFYHTLCSIKDKFITIKDLLSSKYEMEINILSKYCQEEILYPVTDSDEEEVINQFVQWFWTPYKENPGLCPIKIYLALKKEDNDAEFIQEIEQTLDSTITDNRLIDIKTLLHNELKEELPDLSKTDKSQIKQAKELRDNLITEVCDKFDDNLKDYIKYLLSKNKDKLNRNNFMQEFSDKTIEQLCSDLEMIAQNT
ncbi:MAG: AAA family ATPase [Candidatus Cloacimonetes bacterium]|nr:AAA family ATPase [Candidatus Cloacimonadota bacterium]